MTLRNAALGNNAMRDRLLEIRESNPVPTISATDAIDEAKALKYDEDLRQWVTQTLIPEMQSREGVRETEEKDRVMMEILWFPSLANIGYSIFFNMMLFSQLLEFASCVQLPALPDPLPASLFMKTATPANATWLTNKTVTGANNRKFPATSTWPRLKQFLSDWLNRLPARDPNRNTSRTLTVEVYLQFIDVLQVEVKKVPIKAVVGGTGNVGKEKPKPSGSNNSGGEGNEVTKKFKLKKKSWARVEEALKKVPLSELLTEFEASNDDTKGAVHSTQRARTNPVSTPIAPELLEQLESFSSHELDAFAETLNVKLAEQVISQDGASSSSQTAHACRLVSTAAAEDFADLSFLSSEDRFVVEEIFAAFEGTDIELYYADSDSLGFHPDTVFPSFLSQADGAVFCVGEGGDEEFFDCEETDKFFDCVSSNTKDCRAADFEGEGLIAEKARSSRPQLRVDLDSQCSFTLCFRGVVQGRIVREWPCISRYREVWGQRAIAQTTTRGIVRFHFRIPDGHVKGVLLLCNLSDDESVGCLVHCPELSRFDGTATLRDTHGNLVRISLDPSPDSPTYPFHASALGNRDEMASTGLDECEHKSSSALVTSALGCHGKEKEGGSTTTIRVPTK
uniref:Uncharacterized protein n=1 Tax=Chromera velia CCMP2878 TaxID=1169474 RepID=A0A0G4HME8_9ALVE|eukprot:Cvel_29063.t1-p1 / transcript=Cvel_29063.t1 / gene=Cvel_29063 / organism=Chromera_velia_CCMP2878 / gene_product=hypothetical protein / transcript_product=hypothetical protein / location=Cvel_scaffold3918:6135-8228(+) / protein_length=622 / sequence_SO=supercontig / SO=protein_coding / is_pseudo=false